ncbi:hypothetical protein PROFUN_15618, partial [Planoprotostelium fungivorum]
QETVPLKELYPPETYGIVEKHIYRSNSLNPLNFPFIKQLGLKTILQLSPEVPTRAVSTFFQENDINLIHLGLKVWKPDESWRPVTEELIKEALEILLNKDNHPIMLMCARLQNWSLNSILVEVTTVIFLPTDHSQYKSYACHRSTRRKRRNQANKAVQIHALTSFHIPRAQMALSMKSAAVEIIRMHVKLKTVGPYPSAQCQWTFGGQSCKGSGDVKITPITREMK